MNPVINLGIISIHWYSLFIFLGIILGSEIVIKEAKRHGFTEDFMVDLLFYAIIIGIIGARIYYVIFNLDYYQNNLLEIFEIWHGGLAIHGGIIGGIICLSVICYKKKINVIKILDILVVGFILAQAIGRWGNFFNGEAHGPVTTLAYLKSLHLPNFIIKGMYIDNHYYIPTFLYESLWCFMGFIILIFLRKSKNIKIGFLTSFYLIWYGIERFFVEGLRTDSLMFLGIKMAQVVSIIMIICGIGLFIYGFFKFQKYHEEA